jgi:hypothetical protein
MYTKKFFPIIIILVLCSNYVLSQDALKQGVYNLGGSVAFSYSENTMSGFINSEYEKTKTTQIQISPSFNYFVIDNLLIGGNLTLYYSETKIGAQKFYSRQYGIGPNIRYYFKGSEVIPFIGAGVNYFTTGSNDLDGIGLSAVAGINYFLSGSAAVEPYLQYSYNSYKHPDQNTNSISIGIRMNYFIMK